MVNGLILGIDEFETLPQKKQMKVLYENQVKTIELIKGYKFWYKLNGAISSGLAVVTGWLVYIHIKV